MSYDTEFLGLLRSEHPTVPKLENPIANITADQTCTYYDFIVMLEKVIKNVLPDCRFMPDEDVSPELYADKSFNQPIISYKVYHRQPFKEIKPQERHEVVEHVKNGNEQRVGTLYAQRMRYILQFNVFSSGYATAEKVMNNFEEVMLSYTFYFKKNGVVEMVFKEQLEDSSYENFRKTCSCRNLRYETIFEKNWIDFENILESVQISQKHHL